MNRLRNINRKYLVLLLVAGVCIVLFSDFALNEKRETSVSEEKTMPDTENTEERLKTIIESLEGISDVSVFISYDNKGQKTVASQGEENTTVDGTKKILTKRIQTVTKRDSSGESPFVTEELMPRIRGIIIAARGVGDEKRNALITQAVSSALNVPIHRVKVLNKD